MIRREEIHPNENGEVTLDMLIEAAVRACTLVDFAGGGFSLATERAPTGFPGEMYTTKAGIEWKHDVRVKARPEQFERPTSLAGVPIPEPSTEPSLPDRLEREQREMAEAARVNLGTRADPASSDRPESEPEPDGFDYSRLDEEDVEEPVATP